MGPGTRSARPNHAGEPLKPLWPAITRLIGRGSTAMPVAILSEIYGEPLPRDIRVVRRVRGGFVEFDPGASAWEVRNTRGEVLAAGQGVASFVHRIFGQTPGELLAAIAVPLGIDLTPDQSAALVTLIDGVARSEEKNHGVTDV